MTTGARVPAELLTWRAPRRPARREHIPPPAPVVGGIKLAHDNGCPICRHTRMLERWRWPFDEDPGVVLLCDP